MTNKKQANEREEEKNRKVDMSELAGACSGLSAQSKPASSEHTKNAKHFCAPKQQSCFECAQDTPRALARACLDISKDHELSVAVMNLIAIEEHLAFTISKCKKAEYISIYNEIRKLRSKYLARLVKNKDGEAWCISKHLLAATMRLLETGIKYAGDSQNDEAMEYFNDAIETYQLFWLIQRMGEEDGNDGDTEKEN